MLLYHLQSVMIPTLSYYSCSSNAIRYTQSDDPNVWYDWDTRRLRYGMDGSRIPRSEALVIYSRNRLFICFIHGFISTFIPYICKKFICIWNRNSLYSYMNSFVLSFIYFHSFIILLIHFVFLSNPFLSWNLTKIDILFSLKDVYEIYLVKIYIYIYIRYWKAL